MTFTQLLPEDKFIVDRGNKTHKTTFNDLEQSLNLEHHFTAEVINTPGGTVIDASIIKAGQGFLEGVSYVGRVDGTSLEFIAQEVLADGGLKTILVLGNDPTELNKVFVANPILFDGALKSVTITSGPGLSAGSSSTYNIRQDIGGGIINSSGSVLVTNTGSSFTAEIISRGAEYNTSSTAYLEYSDAGGNTSNGPAVTITTYGNAETEGASISAELKVTDIQDGAVSDKAELVVTLGDNEEKVYLVPGEGISLTNGSLDNEIVINNLLNQLDGNNQGGNNSSMGATVIVDEFAPALDVYPMIQDGTLWYNLIDGRLYVAVTYTPSSGSLEFQWIDASPASFNDSLRKNQNDETFYNISVTKNSSVNPNGGTLYAYHYDLESLPLIS